MNHDLTTEDAIYILKLKFPKLEKDDVEWLAYYFMENDQDISNIEPYITSPDVLLIYGTHSGGDEPWCKPIYNPDAKSVHAVIHSIHRTSIGMNYNKYVDGVIYNNESLSFNSEQKYNLKTNEYLDEWYVIGNGKHVNDVLKSPLTIVDELTNAINNSKTLEALQTDIQSIINKLKKG